jgi:mRNA-degrading endonuclease RelE of RelBE toxin-antitoxin system
MDMRLPAASLRARTNGYCIDDYVSKRVGGVKKLKAPLTGFRLRCGDFRVFFDYKQEKSIEITGVKNRKDAYR